MVVGFLLLSGWGLRDSLADEDSEALAEIYLQKAQEATQPENRSFWMARYIGEVACQTNLTHSLENVKPLLDADPAAGSSIPLSQSYDPSFLNWFVDRSRCQWNVPDGWVVEWDNSIQLNGVGANDHGYEATYFVSIYASPRMQGWSIGGEPKALVVSSVDPVPSIHSGRIDATAAMYFDNVPLEMEGRALQILWKPKFEDLDGDSIPEFFFRYNSVGPDGFQQELAIYKFVNYRPTLLKKFVGHDGGIARKIEGNKIQVAEGNPNTQTMQLDTWEFQGNDFSRVKTEVIPNVYLSEEWKKYNLDGEDPFPQ